jgi:hypothetical protein
MAFMGEKRIDKRTAIMARAEASWVDLGGTPHVAPGMLEETSAFGACLRLQAPIRVGAKVTVKWRREQFSGIVKHMKREQADYILGIERETPWTPNR